MIEDIKIGKNVLENLTTGMYEDSKFIYREYIQNAADSIDYASRDGLYEGEEESPSIDIEIDRERRNIRIIDNGYGIKQVEVHQKLANIADSTKKKGIDKGFRGIGRLGGLAYCRSLKFKTTYPGENIETTMIWNAAKLIQMLNDTSVTADAEKILQDVISYTYNPCPSDTHYFIVELDEIKEENKELLDTNKIYRYISENAPVDYSVKFHFREKIYQYIKENNLSLSRYRITIEGEDIQKEYSPKLFQSSGVNSPVIKEYDEIQDIEFKEFKNKNGELLGWLWFGISRYEKQIPVCNQMRGLRLRKENIQIGDERTLVRFFKEPRGNMYFIGEVHAVHKDLIPNARRDYFNENYTRVEFEAALEDYFCNFLTPLYRNANNAKNALKKEQEHDEAKAEYEEKLRTGFTSTHEKDVLESKVRIAEAECKKAQDSYIKLVTKSGDNPVFSKVISAIESKRESQGRSLRNSPVTLPKTEERSSQQDEVTSKPSMPESVPLITDSLVKLSPSERELIGRVYGVINKIMPPDKAAFLIRSIQDELNNNE